MPKLMSALKTSVEYKVPSLLTGLQANVVVAAVEATEEVVAGDVVSVVLLRYGAVLTLAAAQTLVSLTENVVDPRPLPDPG